MSNYNHQLFLEESIALLKSIVLKSEYSALNINELLSLNPANGPINLADKRTWKYYLNLAGKRHPSDPQIRVVSMDTGLEIDFTPENLVVHTATARAYQPGNQKYKELLVLYPGMEVLIHGILFPVNIDAAINAKDFTILNWSRQYVEVNEENLIADLQDWIYGMVDRFYVQAMDLAEELYTASFIGMLYTVMPQVIVTLRQAAAKTDRAHSFHVKAYLASHNRLDKFYDHMTTRQAMFFYKNIKYLQRNVGQSDSFDWLQDEVLTRRGLPLAEYKAEQIYTEGQTQPIPTVSFFSKALSIVPSLAAKSVTVAELLAKEVGLAPGNMDEVDASIDEVTSQVAFAGISSMRTKVLESSVLQTSEGSTRTLQDTALSLWAMCAGTNRYSTFVYFTDPISGEQIGLSAINAYHYFMYAYFQSMGVQLTTIPPVIAIESPLWPKPDFEKLYSSLNPDQTSRSFAQRMYNLQPPARLFANNDQFHAFVESQADTLNHMYMYAGFPENLIARADALRLLDVLNHTQLITRPEQGDSFEAFLVANQLPVAGLSVNQWKEMYGEIFEKATGQQLTQVEARSAMQVAMVRMMSHLSSYSVQFVSQISGSQVTSLRWSAIRFGQAIEGGGMVYTANLWPFKIMDHEVHTGPSYFINIPNMLQRYSVSGVPSNVEFLDMSLKTTNVGGEALGASGLFFGLRSTEAYREGSAEINGLEELSWMDPLPTTKELEELNDRYGSMCRRFPELPAKVNLDEFVRSERLNSFYAMGGINRQLRGWNSFSLARQLRYFGNDLTIIVLDAFVGVYGDFTPDVFNSSLGVHLLDLFKFVQPLSHDPYDNFVYAAHTTKLGTLRFGNTPDDIQVGSFIVREQAVTAAGDAYMGAQLALNLRHSSAKVNFSFKMPIPKMSINVRYNGHSFQLDLRPGPDSMVTSFYFNGDPLIIGPIQFHYRVFQPNISFAFAHPNYRLPKPKYGSTRAHTQMRFLKNVTLPTVEWKPYTTASYTTQFPSNRQVDGVDLIVPPTPKVVHTAFVSTSSANDYNNGSLGRVFVVNRPITISALGFYCSSGEMLAEGSARLSKRDPDQPWVGQLLEQMAINADNSIVSDGYAYRELSQPLKLAVGEYVAWGESFSSASYGFLDNPTTQDASGAITFGSSVYGSANSLPDTDDTGRFYAPVSFRYTVD